MEKRERNRIAAQESRQRKKELVGCLWERISELKSIAQTSVSIVEEIMGILQRKDEEITLLKQQKKDLEDNQEVQMDIIHRQTQELYTLRFKNSIL